MLKRLLLTGLFTVILGISTTRGQTVLSLQECIDRALEQNLDVEHAKQGFKKIRESVNEAARVTTDVSRLQIMQTKEEVVYNVSATYYNIQTLTEQAAVLKENLESNEKLISASKKMLENELISTINYNRLLVNRENIRAELEIVQNNMEKHLTLLRYLMGADLKEEIRLSPLQKTVPSIVPKVATAGLGSHTRLELLQRQQRLTELEKKSLKASYLPTLYPDTAFAGTVTVVSASADASRKFEVKIRVDNSHRQLRAGMFGKISPVQTRDSMLTVPRTALMGAVQSPRVFVVRGSIARLQDIEIGQSNDRLIGVTSGLQEGDIIITKGQINITDGTKVQGS